jgi:hypothetical protein
MEALGAQVDVLVPAARLADAKAALARWEAEAEEAAIREAGAPPDDGEHAAEPAADREQSSEAKASSLWRGLVLLLAAGALALYALTR